MSNLKNARLDIRLTKEQKSFFEYVANLQGIGLTEFILTAAQKYALHTVEEQKTVDTILASKQDQQVFFDALANAPEPSAALKAVADHYKKQQK